MTTASRIRLRQWWMWLLCDAGASRSAMTTGRHRAAAALLVFQGRRRGGTGSFCISGCDGGVQIQGVERCLAGCRIQRRRQQQTVWGSKSGGLVDFGKNAPALRFSRCRDQSMHSRLGG
ncbi:hypothetical protein C8F04DRAFT_1153638 [Mycena alexandri]|uniref:Secreted protein n=1 Tax=Mycena alexandri TaxID=1745969 RepID=A0AAD6RZF7_9AGAR|nr:hypothetical protein C8F04DRAFT_1153638 [Mycena alexandri]